MAGFDPGTTTGVVVVQQAGDGWVLLERRDICAESFGGMLACLWDWMTFTETPIWDVMAMENLQAHVVHNAERNEAQGIIRLFAELHLSLTDLREYTPATVRSRMLGSGRASDKDIRALTRHLLRMPERTKRGEALSKHQSDALLVALCALVDATGITIKQCKNKEECCA